MCLSIIQGSLNKHMIILCVVTPLSGPVKSGRINFSYRIEKWATDFDLQGFIITLQQNQDYNPKGPVSRSPWSNH